MAGPATILREIHRLQRHAKNLQAEIERTPRLLKAQQAKVSRQEEALREAQEFLKKLKVASHELEVQRKGTLQLIEKHKKQLNESTSKKEYDALRAEIGSEEQKVRDLEDKILESLIHIDDQTALLPELEKAIQQAKVEYTDAEKTSQGRQAGLAEQLNQACASIKDTEVSLPSDVRPLYDRLVTARGEDALAAVENRTCMACYTEITAQSYNDLMLSQFVMCKSCGRVLYLPE
jgi:predicted  nucleic acid-binding Zn-ribbon protein